MLLLMSCGCGPSGSSGSRPHTVPMHPRLSATFPFTKFRVTQRRLLDFKNYAEIYGEIYATRTVKLV
jgi:hypothetical protein